MIRLHYEDVELTETPLEVSEDTYKSDRNLLNRFQIDSEEKNDKNELNLTEFLIE